MPSRLRRVRRRPDPVSWALAALGYIIVVLLILAAEKAAR